MPLLSYRIVSKNSVSSVTAASEPFMITPMIAIGSMRVFFISAIIPKTKPGIANMKVDAASEPPSGGESSDDVPVSDMNKQRQDPRDKRDDGERLCHAGGFVWLCAVIPLLRIGLIRLLVRLLLIGLLIGLLIRLLIILLLIGLLIGLIWIRLLIRLLLSRLLIQLLSCLLLRRRRFLCVQIGVFVKLHRHILIKNRSVRRWVRSP